jgi:hypothetical protein
MSQPFEFVESGGWKVPLYLLQFDKDGAPTSVESRRGLLDEVRSGKYRDVYVFAHGWNNDFNDSLELFRRFFQGFLAQQPADRVWAPVFVGLQWPSVVLVFPWEKGVRIAGDNAEAEFQKGALAWVCEEFEKASLDPDRVTTLAQKETLNEAEQRELAGLLRMVIRGDTAEMSGDAMPTQDELIAAAGELQKASAARTTPTGEFGLQTRIPGSAVRRVQSALNPRNLVRTATVHDDDRAGIIGSKV